jgi:hypothetical protein
MARKVISQSERSPKLLSLLSSIEQINTQGLLPADIEADMTQLAEVVKERMELKIGERKILKVEIEKKLQFLVQRINELFLQGSVTCNWSFDTAIKIPTYYLQVVAANLLELQIISQQEKASSYTDLETFPEIFSSAISVYYDDFLKEE